MISYIPNIIQFYHIILYSIILLLLNHIYMLVIGDDFLSYILSEPATLHPFRLWFLGVWRLAMLLEI